MSPPLRPAPSLFPPKRGCALASKLSRCRAAIPIFLGVAGVRLSGVFSFAQKTPRPGGCSRPPVPPRAWGKSLLLATSHTSVKDFGFFSKKSLASCCAILDCCAALQQRAIKGG